MPLNSFLNFRMSSLQHVMLRQGIPLLFLPAGIGLLFQSFLFPSAAQTILAIALAIFCPELARMAWIDLKNIETIAASTNTLSTDTLSTSTTPEPAAAAKQNTSDALSKASLLTQQLKDFHTVVVSTIALEATGFYLSLVSPPLGAIVIISSQLWFNLLANIQLHPNKAVPIVPCGIADRKAILSVNILTTVLLCLWPIASARLSLSLALLTLVILYLITKYIFID